MKTAEAGIPFADAEVAAKFDTYPEATRRRLLEIRSLILDVADRTEGVGALEEALRWGQPSYLTARSGSGSTIRIDAKDAEEFAIFFICHTNLVETFRSLYPGCFRFEGNRAMVFSVADIIPDQELSHCLSLALTYHARKAPRRGRPRKRPV